MKGCPVEQLSTLGISGGGDEASGLDAAVLARDGVEADEVDGDGFEDGEVVGGVTGACAHLVVGEDDIPVLVQGVLDASVLVGRTVDSGCVGEMVTGQHVSDGYIVE